MFISQQCERVSFAFLLGRPEKCRRGFPREPLREDPGTPTGPGVGRAVLEFMR